MNILMGCYARTNPTKISPPPGQVSGHIVLTRYNKRLYRVDNILQKAFEALLNASLKTHCVVCKEIIAFRPAFFMVSGQRSAVTHVCVYKVLLLVKEC